MFRKFGKVFLDQCAQASDIHIQIEVYTTKVFCFLSHDNVSFTSEVWQLLESSPLQLQQEGRRPVRVSD